MLTTACKPAVLLVASRPVCVGPVRLMHSESKPMLTSNSQQWLERPLGLRPRMDAP